MNGHDELCPIRHDQYAPPSEQCFPCDLIAKAREDERANVTAEFMSNHGGRWEYEAGIAAGRAEALGIRVREVMPYANGYFDGEDHMLAKCIAELEALMAETSGDRFHGFWDALAALRSLQEKS